MTINLADNSPRISYSVGQGVTQSTFAVPFEFFAEEGLNTDRRDLNRRPREKKPRIVKRT